MIYVLCFVVFMFFSFSGAENCWQKFWQTCQNGDFYNLSSCSALVTIDAMIHAFCFLLTSLKTLLFPHCSLFKHNTHHVTFCRFGSKMFLRNLPPPSSSKDRPQLEALQSQTESLIQALGSIFHWFFFPAQGVPCGGGGYGSLLSKELTNMTFGEISIFW